MGLAYLNDLACLLACMHGGGNEAKEEEEEEGEATLLLLSSVSGVSILFT